MKNRTEPTIQGLFKSKAAYFEWRAHWRMDYAAVSRQIKEHKVLSRTLRNSWKQCAAQAELRSFQMAARSLMMARESAKLIHQAYMEKVREAEAAEAVKH